MLKKKDFLFTTETTPDVSTDLSASSKKVEDLIGLADAVNVTDSPNCKTRLNSLLVASEIRRSGLDVILQLTGRDRNRVALESVLLGALSVGINLTESKSKPDRFPSTLASFDDASRFLVSLLEEWHQNPASSPITSNSIINMNYPIYR